MYTLISSVITAIMELLGITALIERHCNIISENFIKELDNILVSASNNIDELKNKSKVTLRNLLSAVIGSKAAQNMMYWIKDRTDSPDFARVEADVVELLEKALAQQILENKTKAEKKRDSVLEELYDLNAGSKRTRASTSSKKS